jgi:hypothetical protein
LENVAPALIDNLFGPRCENPVTASENNIWKYSCGSIYSISGESTGPNKEILEDTTPVSTIRGDLLSCGFLSVQKIIP